MNKNCQKILQNKGRCDILSNKCKKKQTEGNMAKIAVLGYGIVGSGTVEVFYRNKEKIKSLYGCDTDIKYILDLRDFPDSDYAGKFTKNYEEILDDDEVTIVVEAMGGLHPSYEYVRAALEAGKSAVTSNKELVACKGAELLALAKEKNVNFLFEASVGGGIPIIAPLHSCLAANKITEVAGILNGTTNFILTKMFCENMKFDDALKMAQELGYAERDPSADVDGIDACRKICILASLAFGKHVYPESVKVRGIREITQEDVNYAASWGGKIKLLGWSKCTDDNKVMITVCPSFVADTSQLASISDVFNGVLVRGDATDDVVFYGKGAGKYPTASAMVADVIDVLGLNGTAKTLTWQDSEQDFIVSADEAELSKYVRIISDNKNILDEIKDVFGEVTMLLRENKPENEFAFVTSVMKSKDIDKKLESLKKCGADIITSICVMDY